MMPDTRWERAVANGSCLMVAVGLLLAPGACVWLLSLGDSVPETGRAVGTVWLTLEALTGGARLLVYRYARQTQRGAGSEPLRLPSPWRLGWIFLLALAGGVVVRDTAAGALLFPLFFLAAAALPPVAAVAWATQAQHGRLTRRDFTLAFIGGATFAVVALAWYHRFYPDTVRLPLPASNRPWLAHFAPTVALHALLWNGGSLLLLGLVRADFFGPSPPAVELMGLTEVGVLLALLALLGAAAWFALGQAERFLGEDATEAAPPTDRALALWAVACLVLALPLGLAALRLLGGGR